jgi:hypothetical protein
MKQSFDQLVIESLTRIEGAVKGVEERQRALEDKTEAGFNSVRAEVAGVREEVRTVRTDQVSHDRLDLQRFEVLTSDIRELKQKDEKAEDTSRTLAMTLASASATLDERTKGQVARVDNSSAWAKTTVTAVLSLLALLVSIIGLIVVLRG